MQTMRSYVIQMILRLTKQYPFLERSLKASGHEGFTHKTLSKADYFDLLQYYTSLVKMETHDERDQLEIRSRDIMERITFNLP